MREILVANTKDQCRYKVYTEATTLGELQNALRSGEGVYKMVGNSEIPVDTPVDFTGMTFTEGLSKTQLVSADSLLPTNVTFKGEKTNNLVMLLTNTTKNIASGISEEGKTRKEAYDVINELGDDLKEFIKDQTGRNYTLVNTNTLWSLIEEFTTEPEEEEDDEDEEEDVDVTNDAIVYTKNILATAIPALESISKTLAEAQNTVTHCVKMLTSIAPQTYKAGNIDVSDEDIDDMIASI